MSFTEATESRLFELKPDGATLFSGQVAAPETTLVDTTVLPARNYLYRAFRLQAGQPADSSDVFSVTTLDTTSHDYAWDIQTIGVFQSSLSDVWGTNAANIYAVGRVEEPRGKTQSNVIHFDGSSWQTVTEAAFDTGFAFGEFDGILGFSDEDIWVVGTNVLHWNGNGWQPLAATLRRTGPGSAIVITLNEVLHGNRFTAIWGASSSELFAVGARGVIVHYDGDTWTKMESGTDLTFQDVWGSSPTDVYAVAMDFPTARWLVVHYDGSAWQAEDVDTTPINRPGSIWGLDERSIFIASDKVYRFDGLHWRRLRAPNTSYNMGGVEGTAINNLFVIGSFGVVLHWNGASWQQYDELLKPEGGRLLRRLWADGQEVFIVGSSQAVAVVIHGQL